MQNPCDMQDQFDCACRFVAVCSVSGSACCPSCQHVPGARLPEHFASAPGARVAGGASLRELRQAEIARIRARLNSIDAGAADATSRHAEAAGRGDIAGALQWEACAKFLALEEWFLSQALRHWQEKTVGGAPARCA